MNCQVPLTATSNSDVIPLGSSIDELEKTVEKLGLEDMKKAPVSNTTFASITANGGGASGGGAGGGNGQGGGRGGAPYGGARSRLDSQSERNILGNILPNERARLNSVSEKRKQDDLSDRKQ